MKRVLKCTNHTLIIAQRVYDILLSEYLSSLRALTQRNTKKSNYKSFYRNRPLNIQLIKAKKLYSGGACVQKTAPKALISNMYIEILLQIVLDSVKIGYVMTPSTYNMIGIIARETFQGKDIPIQLKHHITFPVQTVWLPLYCN